MFEKANAKLKGKISKNFAIVNVFYMLELMIRRYSNGEIGNKCKKILENRINELENGNSGKISKVSNSKIWCF